MKRRAIKKVCVQAEFGFFLMICLFLLMDFGGMGGMCLAAVCLHEAGHLAVLFLLGEQIREIRFCFGGIRIEREENLSLRGEAVVHLSGPCANLCAALCLFESGNLPFSAVHCALGLFELCPLPSLDGGQALFCALQRRISLQSAQKICKKVSAVTLALAFLAGCILLFLRQNAGLLILWLLLLLQETEKGTKKRL